MIDALQNAVERNRNVGTKRGPMPQTAERFGFVTSALPDPRAITSISLLVV